MQPFLRCFNGLNPTKNIKINFYAFMFSREWKPRKCFKPRNRSRASANQSEDGAHLLPFPGHTFYLLTTSFGRTQRLLLTYLKASKQMWSDCFLCQLNSQCRPLSEDNEVWWCIWTSRLFRRSFDDYSDYHEVYRILYLSSTIAIPNTATAL